MKSVAPTVIWFTGLSGAGKSTIASAVDARLRAWGVPTELLDGDAIRAIAPSGFDRPDRDAHVRRVGYMASRLEHHGITSICALISPFADARADVRRMCRRFIEVYVSTPLSVCKERDVKGLYAKSRRGELRGLTGVDSPYEVPAQPELVLDASDMRLEEAVAAVFTEWARASRRAAPASPHGDDTADGQMISA